MTDEETAALVRLLREAIDGDRFPLSPQVQVWRAISARDDKSHKLWTDDYLAAFAQASDATLITLDRKVPARYPSVRVELLLS